LVDGDIIYFVAVWEIDSVIARIEQEMSTHLLSLRCAFWFIIMQYLQYMYTDTVLTVHVY